MIFIVEHSAVFDQDGEILTPRHCMRRNYFKSAVVADQTQGIHRSKSLQKINYFSPINSKQKNLTWSLSLTLVAHGSVKVSIVPG